MLYSFLGADNTGKTHIMIGMAKVLESMGKRVLLIDFTVSRSIISQFNFSTDEEVYDPNKGLLFVREDLDILVPKQKATEKDLRERINALKYDFDYFFIETDHYFNLLEDSQKIFFICNSDKKTYANMKELFMQVESKEKIFMVYNNIVDGKNYKDYIDSLLFTDVPSGLVITDDDVTIPFLENDFMISQAAKINGHFKIRPYSQDYKNALFDLTNKITSIDAKQFRKILRKRSV